MKTNSPNLNHFFFLFIIFLLNIQNIDAQNNIDFDITRLNAQMKNLKHQQDSLLVALEDLKLNKLRHDLKSVGLPALAAGEEVVEHAAMSLVYSEKHEQAKWVAHIILPDIIGGSEGRSNDFRPDPKIKTGSAVEADYFIKTLKPDGITYHYDAFGYDRGHLAPSADFRWSAKALSESYFYSNMSPQVADFNRGRWAELEGVMRNYIQNNPTTQLYVVSGPILQDNLPKIERGINKPSIPKLYFKVVLDLTNKRAIGFIMPNQLIKYPVESFAQPIDKIEAETGIDFFPNLDDALEAKLESMGNAALWVSGGIAEGKVMDVEPIEPTALPAGNFNTIQAQIHAGKGREISVCGTVVSAKLTKKGNIFLNLDKQFPNQVFSVMITKKDVVNFSYAPEKELIGQQICVKGIIMKDDSNVPNVKLKRQEDIRLFTESYE